MEYGVTPLGFVRKRLDVILEEKKSEMIGIFGSGIDLSEESPDGQIVANQAEAEANLWELAEICYNAFNPDNAKAFQLNNLLTLTGIDRNGPAGAVMWQSFAGTSGTLIAAGSIVGINPSTNSDIQFRTLRDITIPESGSVVAQVQCTIDGSVAAPIGSVDIIGTPVVGWDSTSNTSIPTGGTLIESDQAARARRERSTARNSRNIIDSIYSSIADLDGVVAVKVLENKSSLIDANGLSPHSIKAIVLGGVDEQIGTSIYQVLNGGCDTNGSVEVNILDTQGFPQNFKFERPTTIPIYAKITISVYSGYTSNVSDLIKHAVVDYSAGSTATNAKFSLGDNVIRTRLYTPANSINDTYDVDSIEIGIDPMVLSSSDIVLSASELSTWAIENIEVVTV